MKQIKVEETVKKVLIENKKARNDNFILALEVYNKLGVPTTRSFDDLMEYHNTYNLPSFESIMRSRRKIVGKNPSLQASKKIKEMREEQQQMFVDYAIGG